MAKLYLVPTPIGNLEDITFRAVRVLKEVNLILAEDTRKSGILLKHYSISKPLRAFHKHNEHKQLQHIIDQILAAGSVALVSDAGTPGISDPGFLLIRECIARDIEVESLPGAAAFLPALINSGLPSDKFVFEGFLPQKKGRKKRLEFLREEQRTMVFYESPYRIRKFLAELAEVLGPEREASVSRELTKMYEENVRGTLEELMLYFEEKEPKGEFVLVVAGKS